ncbi:MAG TPA: hypothetical protein VEH05_07665 [Streptosporangiaceae bacterium]|nr:hypothetical protein [Streptosporangiaceae bacterium]
MARRYPRYESGPYTPAQGARLLDQFFASLARRRGRLRRVVRLAALMAALAICALLLADASRIFR